MHNPARGTVNIEEKYEGIHANITFRVPSDFGIMNWMSNADSGHPWRNIGDSINAVDINNLQHINGVLRNTQMIHHQLSDFYKSYESGFIDLPNAHSIYFHCPNLGHFNTIGVRGESTITKQTCIFIIRFFDN